MLRYIRKKIENIKRTKYEKKRIDIINYLRNSKNSVNNKWINLRRNKEYLTNAEFMKWDIYLTNYESITEDKDNI